MIRSCSKDYADSKALKTSLLVLVNLEAGGFLGRRDLQRLHRGVVDSLGDAVAEVLVDSCEDRDYAQVLINEALDEMSRIALTLPLLDGGALDIAEVNSNVVHEVSLLGIIEHLLPEGTRLFEVD